MSDNNQRLRRYFATAAIYLAVAASVFGFNVIRSRAARQVVTCLSGGRPENVVNPAVLAGTPLAG